MIELFFDASLLLIFIPQAFLLGCLLTYGYIPIPKDWASEQIAPFLPDGFRLEAETIRLKLNGEIELSNISAWTNFVKQPILEADGAIIHLRLNRNESYLPQAQSLVISNGTLFLPAVYSPDGLRRPILEKIAFRLFPKQDLLRIDSFAAKHDNIRLRGSIDWPVTPQEATEGTPDTRLRDFFEMTSKAIKEKDRFNILTTPTLAFHLTAASDSSIQIDTRLSSRELNHAKATGSNLYLDATIRIKDNQFYATEALRVQATELHIPDYQVSINRLDGVIPKEELQTLLQGEIPNFKLFAREFSAYEIDLVAPILDIKPKAFPDIYFAGATSGLKGAVTFSGDINLEKQTATAHAKGSVDLLSLIPEDLGSALPTISLTKAPHYDLNLTLSEGFALESAQVYANTYGVTVDDITFDHISARASFKDKVYSLDDVYVRRDWQWVDLKFSLDQKTWDYKVTLIGSAIPYDYNALLPRWWEAIFLDFDFSSVKSNHGDFIIYGNAERKVADLYYGHAAAENVRYKGVMVDDATLFVRGRGRYVEVAEIDAHSGDGWAKGTIGFSSLNDEVRAPVSLRLNFDAQLQIDDAKKLFGGNISTILDDFESTNLPLTKLEGIIFNKAYPQYQNSSYFNLTADSNGPITFKDVPLDHLNFELFGREEVTHLREVNFGYANGKGSAIIDILTTKDAKPELCYSVKLSNANQKKAISSLPQLDEIKSDLSAKENPTSDSAREAGRVDISLHAKGPVDNPFQHNGYGDFTILNKDLGSVQLLGPLSRLLKNTKFSFTSFNLDTMKATFALQEDSITFNTLQIDGPRTRIKAPGTISIKEQALDMKVSVNLFANMGSPDSTIKKFGDILTSPIPNLLTFDLTGTIQDQKWRSLYDPRNLIPSF
ncbi:MAG: hypothetical protein ACSHX8_10535 [Opitutaceae bacterium]